MRITKVSYRTNVIVPGEIDPNAKYNASVKPSYRSKHVEAEAFVGENESADDVLMQLAQWVHVQLGISRPVPPPKAALRDLGDES